jgi:dTDP-4-amino-4,6-dideoxygalactose transaminase
MIARKYKLHIVEDCAQAIGARWREKSVGTFGLGAFSLHPLKNLAACGDGGFITTESKEIYNRLKSLRNHGLKDRDHLATVGINSRLDEIQAALLNVKLKQSDSVIARRRQNAEFYIRELKALVGEHLLSIPEESKDEFSVYHTFVIRVSNRNELQNFLKERGIETKIHYPSPIHLQLPYQKNSESLPNTEIFASQILSLPIHPNLSEAQLSKVTDSIKEFIATAAHAHDRAKCQSENLVLNP